MKHIRHLATFLAITLIGWCPHAFGLAGDLAAPSLSFPADSKSQESVKRVISDKQFKFLRGHFVNASSTLMFSGDAAALNSFLARLTQCKGAKVEVTFNEYQGDASWTLTHTGWGDPDAFQVAVNTAQIAKAAVKLPK